MIVTLDDELETYGGDDVIRMSPLQELSEDLLTEGLEAQIKNPFAGTTNYLEQFYEVYSSNIEDENNKADDDYVVETTNTAHAFYDKVLRLLDNKFHFDLDFTTIDGLNLKSKRLMAEGLYDFFIIQYRPNMAQYITRVILDHAETIAENLRKMRNGLDDVSNISNRMKMDNEDHALILASINKVIEMVRDFTSEPTDFMKYFNKDYFSVYVLNYMIDRGLLNGEFLEAFLDPVFSETKSEAYDYVLLQVRQNLYERFQAESKLTLDDLDTEEEEDADE